MDYKKNVEILLTSNNKCDVKASVEYFEQLLNNDLVDSNQIEKLLAYGYYRLGEIEQLKSMNISSNTTEYIKHLTQIYKDNKNYENKYVIQSIGRALLTSMLTTLCVLYVI